MQDAGFEKKFNFRNSWLKYFLSTYLGKIIGSVALKVEAMWSWKKGPTYWITSSISYTYLELPRVQDVWSQDLVMSWRREIFLLLFYMKRLVKHHRDLQQLPEIFRFFRNIYLPISRVNTTYSKINVQFVGFFHEQ